MKVLVAALAGSVLLYSMAWAQETDFEKAARKFLEIRPDPDTPEYAVLAMNMAEVKLYENPESAEAMAEFMKWITSGPKLESVYGLVVRAIRNGSKVVKVGEQTVQVESAEVKGDEAIVKTKETLYLKWSSGREAHPQTENPHTYRLKKGGDGKWKVVSDDFRWQ